MKKQPVIGKTTAPEAAKKLMEKTFEIPDKLATQMTALAGKLREHQLIVQQGESTLQATVEGFLADKDVPENSVWNVSPDFKVVFFSKKEA